MELQRKYSRVQNPLVFAGRLFSASKNRSHNARTAVAVYNRYDPQRLLIGRIRNQVFAHHNEA